MVVYHRTFAADAILATGFRDATGTYLTVHEWTGVWVADTPLDDNEGADGDVVLTADVPEPELTEHEWVEDGKPYREFLVPAQLLNRYEWRRLDPHAVEAAEQRRFNRGES